MPSQCNTKPLEFEPQERRRATARAEALPRGPDSRFLATSPWAGNRPAHPSHEPIYRARGEKDDRTCLPATRKQIEERQRGRSGTVATPIPVTGHVLAGGRSARMGRDKALLEIGGQPLILSAVNLLKALTDRVVILGPAERYGFLDVPVLPDLVPSRGPLSAIYTGLEHSERAVNLFLACDMPLMEESFLRLLVERAPLADAVLMRLDDGSLEPLCAIYNRSCLAAVKANYERRRFKLSDLFPELRTRYLGEADLQDLGLDRGIFTNLNTPGDLERWGVLQARASVKR